MALAHKHFYAVKIVLVCQGFPRDFFFFKKILIGARQVKYTLRFVEFILHTQSISKDSAQCINTVNYK